MLREMEAHTGKRPIIYTDITFHREVLEGEGVPTRVVSMPCVEWFREQTQSYRDSVLIPEVKARVSVEAGIAQPWWEWVGSAGRCVSIEHFGASADYQTLFHQFGFTHENVVVKAHESLAAAGERIQPT